MRLIRRSKTDLLLILMRHVASQEKIYAGLCYEIGYLYSVGIYSDSEYHRMSKVISDVYHLDKQMNCVDSSYYWNIGEIRPRLDWINKEINKNWKIKLFNLLNKS